MITKKEFIDYLDRIEAYFDWIDALYQLHVDIINADSLIAPMLRLLDVMFDTILISEWCFQHNCGKVEDPEDFMKIEDEDRIITIHTNEELYDYLVGDYGKN